jgi:hypothetical protein
MAAIIDGLRGDLRDTRGLSRAIPHGNVVIFTDYRTNRAQSNFAVSYLSGAHE